MADLQNGDNNTTNLPPSDVGNASLDAQFNTRTGQDTPSKPKTNMFAWKIGVIICIAAIAVVYSTIEIKVTNTAEAPNPVPIEIDERLLACNKVMSSEPTDDFNTCLSAAQDGEVLAMKRVIWAYARASEFQNWSEVFNWLKALPRKDENTQLLMYTIVHFMASSDDIKKDSEKGITRLVAKNYAPANVILASIYALEENLLPPTSNAQWLLERDANAQANAITPSQLALAYANGLVGNVDIEKASNYLKQVAQRNYPINTNNIAWFLSTLDNNPFTSNEYALSLAKQVTDDPDNAQNPVYIDTLAASLAANGMFEEATQAQQQALDLLSQSSLSERVKAASKPQFESRLALYSKGEVLVEETLKVDKTVFFSQLKTRTVDLLFRDFYVIVDEPAPSNATELDEDKDDANSQPALEPESISETEVEKSRNLSSET